MSVFFFHGPVDFYLLAIDLPLRELLAGSLGRLTAFETDESEVFLVFLIILDQSA